MVRHNPISTISGSTTNATVVDTQREVDDEGLEREELTEEETTVAGEGEEVQVDYKIDAQGRTGKQMGGSEPSMPIEKIQCLMLDLADGLSRADACNANGISMSYVLQRSNTDPKFAADLNQAEAQCKRYHIHRIREGGTGWQSSAWFLERKWRKEFSLTSPDPDDAERTIRVRKVVLGGGGRELPRTPAAERVGCEPIGAKPAR